MSEAVFIFLVYLGLSWGWRRWERWRRARRSRLLRERVENWNHHNPDLAKPAYETALAELRAIRSRVDGETPRHQVRALHESIGALERSGRR